MPLLQLSLLPLLLTLFLFLPPAELLPPFCRCVATAVSSCRRAISAGNRPGSSLMPANVKRSATTLENGGGGGLAGRGGGEQWIRDKSVPSLEEFLAVNAGGSVSTSHSLSFEGKSLLVYPEYCKKLQVYYHGRVEVCAVKYDVQGPSDPLQLWFRYSYSYGSKSFVRFSRFAI